MEVKTTRMKTRSHFAWPACILSAVFAAVSAVLISPARMIPEQTPFQRILWSGGFFLAVYLAGWIGMTAGLWIVSAMLKIRIQYSAKRIPVFLLCAALVFGIGAGGQALFMRSEAVEEYHPTPVDAVLLLDDSSSMEIYDYDVSRTEAACRFVDSLDENTRVQVIAFSGLVREYVPFTAADESGRETIKEGIRRIDLTGRTDLDLSLSAAVDSLSENSREGCSKAIILLTDGEAPVSDVNAQKTGESGIRLFSVRITDSETSASEENPQDIKALTDLTAETGGADIVINPASDGSVSTDELINAFQTAFEAAVEIVHLVPDGLLVTKAGISMYQWAIRILTILLAALMAAFGYYGKAQPAQLLSALLCGMLFTGCIYAFAEQYLMIAVCGGILLGTAIVILRIAGGEDHV